MSKDFLSRDAFLQRAASLRIQPLELEGIGVVGVRELSGAQLMHYNERIRQLMEKDSKVNASNAMEIMALLVSMTVCDRDGCLLFGEEDAPRLAEMSIDNLMRIANKALELSGMSSEKATEAADGLKKALSVTSSTALPTSSDGR